MNCPNCGRKQFFTREEKILMLGRMVDDATETKCYNCGVMFVIHRYDLDKKCKRMRYAELGVCTNCGKRPAVPGFKMCENCRAYQVQKHEETKSTGYYDLFYRSKLPKNENVALDSVSKMAHDKGISYGEMVAIMEGRKREKKDLD